MLDFSTIFSSRAKYLVLRVLALHTQSVPLRHVAYLAELPVYSVQVALKQLQKEKLIKRNEKKHFVMFSFNQMHASSVFIKKVFELEREMFFNGPTKQDHERAQSALKFADDMIELFRKVKK
jgi:hypothetical protein